MKRGIEVLALTVIFTMCPWLQLGLTALIALVKLKRCLASNLLNFQYRYPGLHLDSFFFFFLFLFSPETTLETVGLFKEVLALSWSRLNLFTCNFRFYVLDEIPLNNLTKKSDRSYVYWQLSQMIKPSSFTLEHMAASLSQFGDQSIPSAPKEFSVWVSNFKCSFALKSYHLTVFFWQKRGRTTKRNTLKRTQSEVSNTTDRVIYSREILPLC